LTCFQMPDKLPSRRMPVSEFDAKVASALNYLSLDILNFPSLLGVKEYITGMDYSWDPYCWNGEYYPLYSYAYDGGGDMVDWETCSGPQPHPHEAVADLFIPGCELRVEHNYMDQTYIIDAGQRPIAFADLKKKEQRSACSFHRQRILDTVPKDVSKDLHKEKELLKKMARDRAQQYDYLRGRDPFHEVVYLCPLSNK